MKWLHWFTYLLIGVACAVVAAVFHGPWSALLCLLCLLMGCNAGMLGERARLRARIRMSAKIIDEVKAQLNDWLEL